MRIFVTGGSGFIGRNLVEHLEQSHQVLAPSHAELDLTDHRAVDEWFARNDVDAVVCGAVRPGHRNAPDTTRQLWCNLRMLFGVLRNRERFGRLIFLSSGAVYDVARPLREVSEEELGASLPADEHGLSKYVIARHLECCAAAGGPGVVELRLFGVFGKYEDYAIRFISNAICKTLFDLPITLRQNRTFSYLFIDDLMPVVDHFLSADAGAVAFNVVPDHANDLLDLATLVRDRSGKDVPILVAAEGTGLPYSGRNDRLRTELPDLSFTPTELAIDKLYLWYEEHRHDVDRHALLRDK